MRSLARFLVIVTVAWPVLAQTTGKRAGFHWDWRHARELSARQSLRDSSLPQGDKDAIAGLIEDEFNQHEYGPEIQSESQLRKAVLDTRIELVDLNGDGIPEVVAQAMTDCSPTGNCDVWIFQKARKGYRLLLEGFGQTITIQKMRSSRFAAIVISMHGSATESELREYRYADGRYRETGCYGASWEEREADNSVRELKEPRITPCESR